MLTAAFLILSTIPAFAKPVGIYLKSKSDSKQVLYISYYDYIRAHASQNEAFRNLLKDYEIAGISVETDKNKKVIDYAQYEKDYIAGNIKNLDAYADQSGSQVYVNPEIVKELNKDGTIGEEINAPDKPGNPQVDYIPIAEARVKANAEIVTVKGVVTSIIGNNAYIQDSTAGIYIYMSTNQDANLIPGNVVKVTGALDEYYGLKQIKYVKDSTKIEFVEIGQVPEAKLITADNIGEAYESQLVTVKNITITSVGSGTSGYDILAKDENNVIVNIRVDKNLKPYIEASSFRIGSIIDVTAPIAEYIPKGKPSIYQLMLRNINDVKVIKDGNGEVPGNDGKAIRDIQGKSHKSPLVDEGVTKVKGIVTSISNDKYQKGFFMQDPNPDNDPATSEGIFVKYSTTSNVKVGDSVSVDGTVKELLNGTNEDGLLETTIEASAVKVESSNNPLPAAIAIDLKGTLLNNIDNDNFKSFDINEDSIDYFESLEGMLVKIVDPLIVGAGEKYGEIYVVPNNGVGSEHQRTPHGGIKALLEDFNPEAITIDDVIVPITGSDKKFIDKNLKIKVGDSFEKDANGKVEIIGVMSYGFGKYKFLNTQALPKILPTGQDREVTTIAKEENKLTVATYNIENFNKSDQNKVNKVAKGIVDNLKTPDIVGLIEVQDNDGETSGGNTDASQSYSALIAAIKNLSGVDYEFTDIAPEDGKDGGAPKGNIRNGFIYRKDRVSLVNKNKGDAKTAVSVDGNGLSVNPGRIDPNNEAFNASRKPLIAEFEFKGEKVFIIANHLNSKGGDGSLFGNVQPPVRTSEVQRHKQATIINSFIKELQTKVPNANVVTLGDLNDFEFSETLNKLKGTELTNMLDKLSVNERYTYIYSGNSQVLDHVLVSNNLFDKAIVDIVHINSQFTEGYGRVSDHDPVLVQLDLGVKEATDEEILLEAKNALNLQGLDNVTANLNLPTELAKGVKVTWTSNNEAVIANDGKVTRPEAGNPNATVKLTATLSLNGKTETKEFNVTVIANAVNEDQKTLEDAKSALDLGDVSAVVADMTLKTELNGVTITWDSSDKAVIANDGKVTRPENGQGNKTVTLTATLTYKELTATKVFTVTVNEKDGQQNNTQVIFEEKFDDIATWANTKVDGSGVYFSSSKAFVTGTAGGVQKGDKNLILNTTGSHKPFFDIKVDFTNTNNLKFSFNWSKIENKNTGTPPAVLRTQTVKLQYSLDNGASFITINSDLTITNTPDAQSGNKVIELPSELAGKNVVLRFLVEDKDGTGNRPKLGLDDIKIEGIVQNP